MSRGEWHWHSFSSATCSIITLPRRLRFRGCSDVSLIGHTIGAFIKLAGLLAWGAALATRA